MPARIPEALALLVLAAACGGTTPPPQEPAAPDANQPTLAVTVDAPLHAGQPGVVHLDVVAPEATTLHGTYRGFTPEFPMQLEAAAPGAAIEVHPAAEWSAWRVRYQLTVTPERAGPLPLVVSVHFDLCTDQMCSRPLDAELRHTLDVEP